MYLIFTPLGNHSEAAKREQNPPERGYWTHLRSLISLAFVRCDPVLHLLRSGRSAVLRQHLVQSEDSSACRTHLPCKLSPFASIVQLEFCRLRYVVRVADNFLSLLQLGINAKNGPSMGPWTIAQIGYQKLALKAKMQKCQKVKSSFTGVLRP